MLRQKSCFTMVLLIILSSMVLLPLVIDNLFKNQSSLINNSSNLLRNSNESGLDLLLMWNNIWGGSGDDYGEGVAVDATGAIYCIGTTQSFGNGKTDLSLIKYFPNSTKAWNVTWGGSDYDYGGGVAVDASGALYCVGTTLSFGAGSYDLVLLKYFSNGTKAWNTTWGGSYWDYGGGVAVDATGAIYCVGVADYVSGLGERGDLVLLKFYSNGSKAWQTTWGGSGSLDWGSGVAVDATGALYCVGSTSRFGAGGYDLVLLKFFSNGTKAWQTTWGGVKYDYGDGVAVDATGTIYCVGETPSFGAGSYDLVLLKVFSNGTTAWNTTWGGSNSDYGRGVAVDATGVIFCVGSTYSFEAGRSDLVLLKVFSNGTMAWNTTWGGSNSDSGSGVAVDATGAIFCVGFTFSFGAGRSDLVLLKFSQTTISLNTPILEPITPNPNSDGLIELNWTDVAGASIYYIYRSTSNITSVDGMAPIASVTQSAYQERLTANGLYYYGVIAADLLGNISLISNCEAVIVFMPPFLDPIAPNPDSDGLIELNWNDVAAESIYYIYRSTSNITSVDGLIPIAQVTRSAYQDRIIYNGTYYYVVMAVDLLGNMSSISNCEVVTVLILPNPLYPANPLIGIALLLVEMLVGIFLAAVIIRIAKQPAHSVSLSKKGVKTLFLKK